MDTPFSILPGNVTKYATEEKWKKIRHIYPHHIIYTICFLSCIIITFIIFKICIGNKASLSNTIALGSIFATFGSAIISLFSVILSNTYERFSNNINILFNDLCPQNEWHRWPFIKRESHSILYNNKLTYQILKNIEITFNVGSHSMPIFLPTIREDFYDLPNWKSLKNMLLQSKNYESYVLNNFADTYVSLLVWYCVLDNFIFIAKYKLAKLAIIIGGAFIFSSIVFAFFYTTIPI